MASQQIMYLVTSGQYDDMRPEVIATSQQIADATAARVEHGDVWPLRVVDYVPARIPVFSFVLRLDPFKGWAMWREDEEGLMWDFAAPKFVVGIQTETYRERRGDKFYKIQKIILTHRDRAHARVAAETMLAALQAGARPPAEETDGPSY